MIIRQDLPFQVSLGMYSSSEYSSGGIIFKEILNMAMEGNEDARQAIQYVLWVSFKQAVLDFEKTLK